VNIALHESGLAYVGLGSNLDDPIAQVNRGFDRLDQIDGVTLIARSSLYRSAPFGPVDQPEFVNAVACLKSALVPESLLNELHEIERSSGREREIRWGPRTLDLDLLVFGDQEIDRPGIRLPHPGIAERNFVLLPLVEIAPKLLIPGLGRVSEMKVQRNDPQISRIS
jgi:2-amino-4-hydroxy-6-hydroxymethyldihydropteridine diphosphokinase